MIPSPKIGSRDVTGSPAVDNFDYQVTLTDTCPNDYEMLFDQDGDQRLTMGDVAEWVANPRDFNADGESNPFDLSMLVRVVQTFGH